MKAIVTTVAALLVLGLAQAGEVFVTKDAQGHPIYTDRPDSLPAERLKLASKSTDTGDGQKRYAEEMKGYAASSGKPAPEAIPNTAEGRKAKALTAEDKAKRCQDARQ